MRMQTPPENQGKMVAVSYGWSDGSLYKRVYDASDRSESWYVCDDESAQEIPEEWDAANGEPPIENEIWTECAKPE
jgi:hypothetical protein